jgi:hypothetical protein
MQGCAAAGAFNQVPYCKAHQQTNVCLSQSAVPTAHAAHANSAIDVQDAGLMMTACLWVWCSACYSTARCMHLDVMTYLTAQCVHGCVHAHQQADPHHAATHTLAPTCHSHAVSVQPYCSCPSRNSVIELCGSTTTWGFPCGCHRWNSTNCLLSM